MDTTPGPDAPDRTRRRSLLLLENDAIQAETVAAALEYAGYACEIAESVELARAALARDGATFDALITDFTLGPVDGVAFIEEARALPGYAALPAVVATGHTGAQVRAGVEALGRAAYLLKPFSIDSALAALAQLLDGAQDNA